MRNILIILVLSAALAGCAKDVYLKDGATEAEFNQDQGQCVMYATSGIPLAQAPYIPPTYTSTTTGMATYSGYGGYGQVNGVATTTTTPDYSGQAMANLGTAIGNSIRQKEAMHACMASKGYTLQK